MGLPVDFHKIHVRLCESCHLCGVALSLVVVAQHENGDLFDDNLFPNSYVLLLIAVFPSMALNAINSIDFISILLFV